MEISHPGWPAPSRMFGFVRDITERKRAEVIKEAFLSLGAKLSAVRTPAEAARAVYATADQLWQWDAATLDLYSPEPDCMEPVLFYDLVDGQRREVPSALPAGHPYATVAPDYGARRGADTAQASRHAQLRLR